MSAEMPPFVIALDGPAASGKSSVGHGVARELGFTYFDTGLLYRVLTWLALRTGAAPSDEAALVGLVPSLDVEIGPSGGVLRHGEELTAAIREPGVDAAVSAVAAHAGVREAMKPAQRALIRPPGLVMAGRDIGTVIAPDAPLKIWLSASTAERARRRAAQTGADYATVLGAMRQRDAIDAGRDAAPMVPAADAIDLLTDGLELPMVIARIVDLARARGA
jgi:cytidylate kinase